MAKTTRVRIFAEHLAAGQYNLEADESKVEGHIPGEDHKETLNKHQCPYNDDKGKADKNGCRSQVLCPL